jgi:hypothetical protein
MSEEGLVEKLLCPVDQSILFSNQSLDDNIYLYCLECEYKKNIGIFTYEEIVKAVEKNAKM